MIEPDSGKLADKIAALRAERAASAPAPAPKRAERITDAGPELPDDLSYMMDSVAEVSEVAVSQVSSDQFVDYVIGGVGIVDAYDRWCGKPRPVTVRDEDEVIVRCPTPSHVDKTPSAALNQSKNQWTCFGCGAGGDVLHLVGANMGLDPRIGTEFMELRKAMMRDLGYQTWTNTLGHEEVVVPDWFGRKPKAAETVEVKAPEPAVPVDEIPDELFSNEEPTGESVFRKKTPAELPEVDAEFLTTLDEMDDIDGRKAKKDRVLGGFRDQVAKSRAKLGPKTEPKVPEKTVEKVEKEAEKPSVAPKIEEKGPEKVAEVAEKPSVAPKTGSKMPKFNLKDSSDPDLPKNQSKNDVNVAVSGFEDSKNTPEEADSDDIADSAGLDSPTMGATPTIEWKKIVPENTFIYNYCELHSKDDVVEEFHFWNAIMAVGLALGRDICLDDDPLVYANLYICVVAKSGTRKSIGNAKVRNLITATFPFAEEAGSGVKHISSPSSGENLIDQFINDQTEDPTSTTTPKATFDWPVEGLLEIPELSGLMEIATRSGNILESALISLYDSLGPITTSSRGSGNKVAKDAFCTILTSTQPDRIRDLVTRKMVDSGLANRFFYVYGAEKKETSRRSILDHATGGGALVSQLHHIRDNMMSTIPLERSVDRRVVFYDKPAGEMYDRFHDSTIHPTKQSDETAFAVRTNLLLKKLILIFTANMGKSAATPEAVEQAIGMWPYILKCYQRVGAKINATEGREKENRIIESMVTLYRKDNRWPTRSELWRRSLRHYPPIVDTEQMNRILRAMEESGQIKAIEPKTGGRGTPQPRYRPTADSE